MVAADEAQPIEPLLVGQADARFAAHVVQRIASGACL